jgi:hypothetical protein
VTRAPEAEAEALIVVQLRHSPSADALSVRFDDRRVAYSEDISRGDQYDRGVDYADDGTPVGVEFLNVSRGVDLTGIPDADQIARALSAYGLAVIVPSARDGP